MSTTETRFNTIEVIKQIATHGILFPNKYVLIFGVCEQDEPELTHLQAIQYIAEKPNYKLYVCGINHNSNLFIHK